jgi:hypothetical protein
MKHRSPVAVILLPFFTFGIYSLYWLVTTKQEMKSLGAEIPTAWLLVLPLVNLYWFWKYCEGVEKVTRGTTTHLVAFLLFILLGPIGWGIIQDRFNKVAGDASVASAVA